MTFTAQRWMVTLATVAFTVSVAATFVTLALATFGKRSPMIDLQIYRWAGLLAVHSGDLYGGYFPHRHLPFTYPPMAALAFVVMAAIPMSVLRWLVTVASISCLIATLWLTWGMLGYRRSARAAATLAAASVTLWLAPVLQTLWLGQINLILMFVIVADLCLPDSARFKGAGVGLAAGFKLVPLIFIPYLLLTRRFRAAGVSLATFGLTIASSQVLLPSQSQKFWFGRLFLSSSRSGNIAYVGDQSLHGALARLMSSQSAEQPYWLVVSAYRRRGSPACSVGGAARIRNDRHSDLRAHWTAHLAHLMVASLGMGRASTCCGSRCGRANTCTVLAGSRARTRHTTARELEVAGALATMGALVWRTGPGGAILRASAGSGADYRSSGHRGTGSRPSHRQPLRD